MRKIVVNVIKKVKPLYHLLKCLSKKINGNKVESDGSPISFKRNDILNVARIYNNTGTFIETGTFKGDTIAFMKDHFARLYSIELSEDLAGKAVKRFETDTNVTIIRGNSKEQLAVILEQIDSACIFWLDGHYSSEFWLGEEYIVTAKGDKDTPILEELEQIANHFVKRHLIFIDDARLFVGKNDYPTINKLKNYVSNKFPLCSFEVKNDVIQILPPLQTN